MNNLALEGGFELADETVLQLLAPSSKTRDFFWGVEKWLFKKQCIFLRHLVIHRKR